MRLKSHEEIIGFLTELKNYDNKMKITFSVQRKIELPTDLILKKKLQNLIFKKVAILNLNGEYKIREIKEESQ